MKESAKGRFFENPGHGKPLSAARTLPAWIFCLSLPTVALKFKAVILTVALCLLLAVSSQPASATGSVQPLAMSSQPLQATASVKPLPATGSAVSSHCHWPLSSQPLMDSCMQQQAQHTPPVCLSTITRHPLFLGITLQIPSLHFLLVHHGCGFSSHCVKLASDT